MGAPKTAMVLAAGIGKRMRPVSATTPKPLVKVGGRALIDHCLDGLAAIGVETAIVNVHYLADLVEAHLARRTAPRVVVSDERGALLDTGGGIRKALPLLGDEAVRAAQLEFVLAGGRAAQPSLAGACAGTMRAWMRCCCSPPPCVPPAIPGAATSSSARRGT